MQMSQARPSEEVSERLSILLVDDESNIRESMAEYLVNLKNYSSPPPPAAKRRWKSFNRESLTAPFWT